MAILGINAAQNAYSTTFTQRNSGQPYEHLNRPPTAIDTVNISEKAMELAQKGQADKNRELNSSHSGTAVSDKILPLEAYSIPGWMGDFTPKHAKIEPRVGQPYLGSNQALRNSLSPGEKEELNNYMHTLNKFYKEESQIRGIKTKEDYYNSIVLNQEPGLSEELRQSVYHRLIEDTRMMGLARKFGVDL